MLQHSILYGKKRKKWTKLHVYFFMEHFHLIQYFQLNAVKSLNNKAI